MSIMSIFYNLLLFRNKFWESKSIIVEFCIVFCETGGRVSAKMKRECVSQKMNRMMTDYYV